MAAASVRTARVARPCVRARHWETDHAIQPGETYMRRVAFPGDEGHELGLTPWVTNECVRCTRPTPIEIQPGTDCVRCATKTATGACCSSHRKPLCHLCYRRTHFVDLCVAGCRECVAEGLPVNLSDLKTGATR